MISCKQATELIIKKEQGKLMATQNLQLQPHLAICNMCRLFEEQSAFIDIAVNKNKIIQETTLTNSEKEALSDSVKTWINK
jgi:hypothetical protein